MSSSSDKRLSVDDLSKDQREVYERALAWCGMSAEYRFDRKLLTIGGYAGTGKSTLLGVLASEFNNRGMLVAYVTFTGKASSVLSRKLMASGVVTSTRLLPQGNGKTVSEKFGEFFLGAGESRTTFCATVHRLIYRPMIDDSTDEVLGFSERTTLDRSYNLIVIDEASMIGGEMLKKLQKFDIPILAVGDHGQLPPVMDVSTLMKDPILRLEKIHRQALGSPIIALSRAIRKTGLMPRELEDGAALSFVSRRDIEPVVRDAYEGVKPLSVGLVCWTNRTRVKLNMLARAARDLRGPPKKREVLICLRNQAPIYNGMRGVVTRDAVDDGRGVLSVRVAFPEEGLPAQEFNLCAFQFNRDKTFVDLEEVQKVMPWVKRMGEAGSFFDNGYAMTCHKSQGSGFQHAIFYVDRKVSPDDEDWRRFAYTAVTRATKRLTVVT